MEDKLLQSLKIDGMTCVNCAMSVEKSIKKLGLDDVHVNFAGRELIFNNNKNIPYKTIEKAIKNAGFSIASGQQNHKRKDQIILGISIAIALYFAAAMFTPQHSFNVYADIILAGIALFLGLYKFGKGAYHSILSGEANMYVLILLGAITAYVFSIYLWLNHSGKHLYFETTAVLIALVLVGDILEAFAIEKTTESLNKLAKQNISLAKRVVNNNIENVSTNALKIKDIIQVNLGDEIATDGTITEGHAFVDESLITGESVPIEKNIGDNVLSGSILVEGNILYEVDKPAHLSTQARINTLVQKASNEKANVQKLADKVSGIFVPIILSISVIAFFINFYALHQTFENALLRSIAVLVISCPCAMGLATPIAVIVGVHKLSRENVLLKSANSIENLANCKQFIFDKTGTLTTGLFTIQNFESDEHDFAKKIIIGLEKNSSHPIAKSILREWKDIDGIELNSIEEIKGKGIQGIDLDNNVWKLGSKTFTNQEISKTLILTKNDNLFASLNIADKLKEGAQDLMAYLNKEGAEIIGLSGDKQEKAQALGKELGIRILGEMLPEDKLTYLDKYGQPNNCMIGDGVNDAPILAKATTAVSFTNASNLAMQQSDIIVNSKSLLTFKHAIIISKQCYNTIKQNLFWAFAYNLVAVPLAVFGIINPLWAAFFMIFSDIVVIGNAFLLKNKKIA